MIGTKHSLQVAAAWISIVYMVCYLGVALLPGVRPWFVRYGLHMGIDMGANALTITTFISGLIIWNVITLLAVWLFVVLHNQIKR